MYVSRPTSFKILERGKILKQMQNPTITSSRQSHNKSSNFLFTPIPLIFDRKATHWVIIQVYVKHWSSPSRFKQLDRPKNIYHILISSNKSRPEISSNLIIPLRTSPILLSQHDHEPAFFHLHFCDGFVLEHSFHMFLSFYTCRQSQGVDVEPVELLASLGGES